MKVVLVDHNSRLGLCFKKTLDTHKIKYESFTENDVKENTCFLNSVQSADCILSFVGNDINSFFINREVINLSEKYKKPFLLLSSFGCGDSWALLSYKAKALFGEKVRYKSLSESWLASSQLTWLIVRPAGLSDNITREQVVITTDKHNVSGYIDRENLSLTLVNVIQQKWLQNEVLYVHAKK